MEFERDVMVFWREIGAVGRFRRAGGWSAEMKKREDGERGAAGRRRRAVVEDGI